MHTHTHRISDALQPLSFSFLYMVSERVVARSNLLNYVVLYTSTVEKKTTRWIFSWEALFLQRSLTIQTSHLGNWSYIEGAHENQPNPTQVDHPTCEQAASRVLYYLASVVHDHMLSYIREAKMPKEAWGNLKNIFLQPTRLHASFRSDKSWTIFSKGTHQSPAPWRSMSYATPSDRSMSSLMMMKWCKYALPA